MSDPIQAPAGRADWLVVDELAPARDGVLAPLYAGAADGRLLMPFCGECENILELEQDVCDGCGSTRVVWDDVEPTGTVHALTRVHRREPSLIRPEATPYYVIDAQLGSGHRLVMTTTRPVTGPLRIGAPIRIGFRTVGGTALPAAEITEQPPNDATEASL